MEGLDREMQRRVWERVRGKDGAPMPPLMEDDLGPLARLLGETGGVYRQLGKQLPGREGERMRRLYQDAESSLACLRGLGVRGVTVQPPKLQPRQALEGCCRREKQLYRELENRSADPDRGPVFRHLARKTADRWAVALEVLGGLA